MNRRRTVAVLGFQNLSGKPEQSWLSTALSEMLTTELSQGDQLRTIPGESGSRKMKLSLSLADADSYRRETLNRIRQNLGSDDVVLGSYVPLGDGLLRLDLRLQDAVAGETLVSVSEKGKESEIDEFSAGRARNACQAGISPLSQAQSTAVKASLPSNPEAARLYAEGLQRLRVFDARSAIDLLQREAALDPNHAATFRHWPKPGPCWVMRAGQKLEAQRALALSSQSSREERLLIEARAHELSEIAQAIESYRALWEFFPDNVDYGLSLLGNQVEGGHGKDAEETLAQLRKLVVSEADGARIDLGQADIAFSLSDFRQQQSLSQRAAARGRAIGAKRCRRKLYGWSERLGTHGTAPQID